MHTRTSIHSGTLLPEIVVVHGLVVASRYMMPVAERLTPFRVFVPDFPGYGDSDKPLHVLNLPELAEMLRAWMDKLGLQRPSMLGVSFGSQIIAEFAVRYPNRIDRAVLGAPTFDRHARSLQQQLWRFFLNARLENPTELPIQAYDYWLAGIGRIRRSIDIALSDRIEDKLPAMQCPTIVVRGAKDPVVPQHWAEEVTRLLPNGRLAIIPGAGHTINYSNALEFSRIAREFLSA